MSKENYERGLQENERYTLRENKAVLYIKAKDKSIVIKLDDGVIIKKELINQKFCDYLVYNLVDRLSHFIELKGSDIIYALKQILETITFLENDKIHCKYVKDAELIKGYIVSSTGNVPKIDYTHRKRLNKKLHNLSKVKLNLDEYVVFVRCVSKISKNYKEKGNYIVLNSNDFPLIV